MFWGFWLVGFLFGCFFGVVEVVVLVCCLLCIDTFDPSFRSSTFYCFHLRWLCFSHDLQIALSTAASLQQVCKLPFRDFIPPQMKVHPEVKNKLTKISANFCEEKFIREWTVNCWRLAFGCHLSSSSAPTLVWFNRIKASFGHDKSISEVIVQHTSYFSPVPGTSCPVKERCQTGLMCLLFEKSTFDIFAFYPASAYKVVNNSHRILLGTKASLTGLSSLHPHPSPFSSLVCSQPACWDLLSHPRCALRDNC